MHSDIRSLREDELDTVAGGNPVGVGVFIVGYLATKCVDALTSDEPPPLPEWAQKGLDMTKKPPRRPS